MELGKHLAREAITARPVGMALLKEGPPICVYHTFWTCFSRKKQVRIGHSRPSKMTCLYVHKTGANRPFSTFKNGHVFRSQGPQFNKNGHSNCH